LPDEYAEWHPFCQAQYLETTTLLPGYILSSQGDRMAMAGSVEGRFPFLDYRLAEMAARIPVRWKMKGLNEKHILKLAAGHMIPETIAARNKQPYRAPDAKSFFTDAGGTPRHEYVDALLDSERIREDGVFDAKAVERLVTKARKGRVIGTKDNMALVGILSTQLVIERFVRDFDAGCEDAAKASTEQQLPKDDEPQRQTPSFAGKLPVADYPLPVYQTFEE
jgi:asparagine synthase (glutamine-hydrolysing)